MEHGGFSMLRSRVVAVLAVAVSAAVVAPAYSATPFQSSAKRARHRHAVPTFFHVGPAFGTIGAPGLGDPFFPLAGNGGYDVSHYWLQLAYDPGTTVLDGTATITAAARQTLTRFDLDLRGFSIGSLKVDGRPASFSRSGQELQITPASALRSGHQFTVTVRYSGASGRPYTPDDLALSRAQYRDIYALTRINSGRAAAYSRLDFGIEHSRSSYHRMMTWHIGLEKAFGTTNFYSNAWLPRCPKCGVLEQDQMPRFPDGGVRLSF